jgi:fatty acid desaturase
MSTPVRERCIPGFTREQQVSLKRRKAGEGMFWAIAIILFVLWALGFFAFHIGTPLIHALIVIAVIVVIWRLLTSRRVA